MAESALPAGVDALVEQALPSWAGAHDEWRVQVEPGMPAVLGPPAVAADMLAASRLPVGAGDMLAAADLQAAWKPLLYFGLLMV